jgi:pimeloyl-ACP methyl ester carboxylesterase
MFDQRGIGNSTVGSKPYTYPQLANDTAVLLDALKIPKQMLWGIFFGRTYSSSIYN